MFPARLSKKLWNLTKTLNEDAGTRHSKTVIMEDGKHFSGKKAANILADSYRDESTTTLPNTRVKEVRRKLKQQLKHQTPTESMTATFSLAELNSAIRKLKTKKSPGKDGITNEMIKHLGPKGKEKLCIFLISLRW